MELKQLHDKLQEHFVEFKSANERAEAERKTLGEATAETKAMVEKANAAISGIEAQQKALETQLARMEAAAPMETPAAKDAAALAERKQAVRDWLRTGVLEKREQKEVVIGRVERKALTAGDETTGGYLQAPELVNEIIKGIIEFSPIRSLARVRSTSKHSVKVRKRTGTFAAQWNGEKRTKEETEGLAYGMEEVPNHELYALVDVTNEDLEDSEFDLEAEIQMEGSEQFGVAEGAGFVVGNGIKKPEGFLTHPDIVSVNSGAAALLTGDGILDLLYSLKTGYARDATMLLNRLTLGAVRKLKDGQGNYLWQPAYMAGQPNMIGGVAYTEVPDMPDVAANSYPIAYGAWRRGYLITDRIQIQTVRDPLTQATDGVVRFILRKRVGGQVVLAESIKKLKVAA